MTSKDFDTFVDDATWPVADKWEMATGKQLTPAELDSLNDEVANYFRYKTEISA